MAPDRSKQLLSHSLWVSCSRLSHSVEAASGEQNQRDRLVDQVRRGRPDERPHLLVGSRRRAGTPPTGPPVGRQHVGVLHRNEEARPQVGRRRPQRRRRRDAAAQNGARLAHEKVRPARPSDQPGRYIRLTRRLRIRWVRYHCFYSYSLKTRFSLSPRYRIRFSVHVVMLNGTRPYKGFRKLIRIRNSSKDIHILKTVSNLGGNEWIVIESGLLESKLQFQTTRK